MGQRDGGRTNTAHAPPRPCRAVTHATHLLRNSRAWVTGIFFDGKKQGTPPWGPCLPDQPGLSFWGGAFKCHLDAKIRTYSLSSKFLAVFFFKTQFARFLLKIGRIGRAKFGRARKMSYLCIVNHDSQAGRSHPMKLGATKQKSNTTKNTLNVWQKLSTPASWQNTSPTTARSTHTS